MREEFLLPGLSPRIQTYPTPTSPASAQGSHRPCTTKCKVAISTPRPYAKLVLWYKKEWRSYFVWKCNDHKSGPGKRGVRNATLTELEFNVQVEYLCRIRYVPI